LASSCGLSIASNLEKQQQGTDMEYWLFAMVFATSNASGPISLGPFANQQLCEAAGKAIAAEFRSARLNFSSGMGPQVKVSCLPIKRQ
jgi:hypothetical protein